MSHKNGTNGTSPDRTTVRLAHDAHRVAKAAAAAEGTSLQAVVERAILGREPEPANGTVYTWPLSAAVTAQVRFTGPVKGEHMEILKAYLDVAKGAMEPTSHS